MDIEEIHSQFVELGSQAREAVRRCQLLLPLVASERVWEKKKFGSIYEYAAKLAGMSRDNVDSALWTLRKVKDMPALQAVAETKGLGRVRVVATIATPETQEFWAEKARTMSQHTLETYVRETCRAAKTQADGVDVNLHLKPDLARRMEVLKKHVDFESAFERAIAYMEQELERAAPEPVKGSSRHIPVQVERFVQARTNGLCAYPGCERRATSLHHTQRWGLEKVHDPARLHGLCTPHERLAHLGLIENEERAPRDWRLKTQADLTADKRFIDQFVALYRPT
jgi:hypothetical protein